MGGGRTHSLSLYPSLPPSLPRLPLQQQQEGGREVRRAAASRGRPWSVMRQDLPSLPPLTMGLGSNTHMVPDLTPRLTAAPSPLLPLRLGQTSTSLLPS